MHILIITHTHTRVHNHFCQEKERETRPAEMDREMKFTIQPFDYGGGGGGETQKEGDVINMGKRRKERQDLQRWTEKWSLLTDSLICCSILVSSRVTRPCSFFFSLMSSSMRSRLRPSFSICPFFLVSSSATSSISRSLWNRRKSCRRSCCSAYQQTIQTIVAGGKHCLCVYPQ